MYQLKRNILWSARRHKIPKQDNLIALGDFNAKVGRDENHGHITGGHSLHETSNNNGWRLINSEGSSDKQY